MQSATIKELVCVHVCVQTKIWTCEVRATQKNGRNSHLDDISIIITKGIKMARVIMWHDVSSYLNQ